MKGVEKVPTIGLHMISKGEAGLLRECLESLKPIEFDQIVVGITHQEGWENSEFRQIIEEYGGEVVDLTWLPKEDIEGYGLCVASFSQARQAVYDLLTTDWAFWIDADDVLDGADLLRPMVEKIDAQGMGALFLPYFYGFDGNGNCITVLTRERAVKRSLNWKWIRRVHEGMMCGIRAPFAKTADIIVRHNSPTGRGWPKRNLVLLMMEYEENPNDARTHCYIGHQHYALQQWAEAIPWYERYLRQETRKEERWQALNFLADCYRFTGQYQLAISVGIWRPCLCSQIGQTPTFGFGGDLRQIVNVGCLYLVGQRGALCQSARRGDLH